MKNTKTTRKRSTSGKRKVNPIRLPRDYHWKILGTLADDLREFVPRDDYALVKEIVRSRDMDAYSHLGELWGLQSLATTDSSMAEHRCRYQLASLLKKFQVPGDAVARRTAAMHKFVQAELSCRDYNHSGYKALAWGEDTTTVNIFTYARAWIEKVIGCSLPSHDAITKTSRHGPGVTLNTLKGRTSKYFKYLEWPYSCCRQTFRHAVTAIKSDPRWLGALEDDYRRRYNIPKHVILNQELFWSTVITIVEGNKIAFVPKSYKIDRTIAIEPAMNLYLQLGVDGFIRKRLKRWDINLDDQTKNQYLAHLGSKFGSDNFATLDLASASDTVSLAICRLLLPPEWFEYLLALRSPYGYVEGRLLRYEKISSMGNGYTFALESLIFGALTYGTLKEKLGTVDTGAFAVYGDDLIVPSYIAPTLITVLNKAGFALNHDKSFLEGPVRESCGTDWFRGSPVRPVFLQSKPSNVKELFTDHNRLKRWFELRLGICNPKTLSLIRRWIPCNLQLHGPYSDEEFDTYLHHHKPISRWVNGVWRYKKLSRKPINYKDARVDLLHFRKLMASLSNRPPVLQRWDKKIEAGGSTFDVAVGNSSYTAFSISRTSVWCDEYTEPAPVRRPIRWAARA